MFSWIVFESREHRDRVNAAVMEDSRIKEQMNGLDAAPFDARRMIYGGFTVAVNA